MSDPWINFQPPSGDYPENKVTFDKVGAGVVGVIDHIRFAHFVDGDVPELWVTDQRGVQWQVTCGPADLQTKLHRERPQVGDMVAIAMTDEKKLGGGKARKLFQVQVRKAGAAQAAAPTVPPVAPQMTEIPAEQSSPPAPAAQAQGDLFTGATMQTPEGERPVDQDLFAEFGGAQ